MAILPETIRFGPAVFSPHSLAMLISFLFGLILLKRSWTQRGYSGQEQAGWIWEAVLVGFCGERAVTIASIGTAEILEHPRSLISAIGPSYSTWVGIAVGFAFLLWRTRREGVLSLLWLEGTLVPLSLSVVLYSVLLGDYGKLTNMPWGVSVGGVTAHPVNLYRALAGVLAALWIQRGASPGISILRTAAGWSLAELVISWFQPTRTVWWGLAPSQWLLVFLFGASLIVLTKRGEGV